KIFLNIRNFYKMQVVSFDYSNSKFELVRHLVLNLALARNNTWSKIKSKSTSTKAETIFNRMNIQDILRIKIFFQRRSWAN
ncbi:hypothetical protein, partial [Desulfobacter sp.]